VAQQERAERPPNIVLIMTDQQRWDALGCAGVFPIETPAMDRLTREGVWFRRAYCNAPLCVPSRMSFLSGRYMHQHGCRDNNKLLWPDAPTFVRALQSAGYHTANIGKLHYTWQHDLEILVSQPLLKRLGFDEPYETTGKMSAGNLRASPYSEHLRARGLLEEYHHDLLRRSAAGPINAYAMRPSMLGEEDHIDGWLLRCAAGWIAANDREPFFLWSGPPGPHDPFDPPEPYASRYRPEEMPVGSLDLPTVPLNGNAKRLPDATPRQIQEMRTQYCGNVTYIDDGIRRIRNALEERGQLTNTWIVLCSDHGEMLGDHRLLNKSEFFEQAARVPVIVRPPEYMDMPRGIASDALIELLDVTATLVEIAGTEMPGAQGRSLLPIVTGNAPPEQHRTAVVSELGERLMLRTAEWKLVVTGDDLHPQSLRNLRNDPEELHNLAGEPGMADVLATLRADPRLSCRDARRSPAAVEAPRSLSAVGPQSPARREERSSGDRRIHARKDVMR